MISPLEVYDCSAGSDCLVGTARFSLRRGMVSTTFVYDDAYIAQGAQAYAIDPSLPLTPGPQHCAGLPGAFRDSAPDRWGRHLIERNLLAKAREEHVAPHTLDDVDYLTGVFDLTREGSLRFRDAGGEFLSPSASVPPLVGLPRLLHAAREVALNEAGRDEIKTLLDAGSGSLGGARPKASVRDGDRLLLAKFSHPGDRWDVMAWEKTALDLAEAAGIAVPRRKLLRIGDENVLLLERFDREESSLTARRIPYMSAMTATGSADGESHDYVELYEALVEIAEDVTLAIRELFARVVFSVAVANTDDHLRNWAFLRHEHGWMLSPLFDANPDPYSGTQRVTGIAGETAQEEALGLREFASYMGIAAGEATRIVAGILEATGAWRATARKNGCSEQEVELFAPKLNGKHEELSRVFCS